MLNSSRIATALTWNKNIVKIYKNIQEVQMNYLSLLVQSRSGDIEFNIKKLFNWNLNWFKNKQQIGENVN